MTASPRRIALGWKLALIVLGTIGLLTGVVRIPGFWSSYILDMVGPAWNYILLRGLYLEKNPTFLSLKIGPETALFLILGICVAIETSQYFELYDAYFDPFDYVAYASLLLPCYLVDKFVLAEIGAVEASQELR